MKSRKREEVVGGRLVLGGSAKVGLANELPTRTEYHIHRQRARLSITFREDPESRVIDERRGVSHWELTRGRLIAMDALSPCQSRCPSTPSTRAY